MAAFVVITSTPPPESGGNLAVAIPLFLKTEEGSARNGWIGRFEQLRDLNLALALHHPVFAVGEILVVNEDGREIGYPGRKPSKWAVGWEAFADVGAAVARARELLDGR